MLTLSSVMDTIICEYYIKPGLEAGEVWGSCLEHHGVWAYKHSALAQAMFGDDIMVILICAGCD